MIFNYQKLLCKFFLVGLSLTNVIRTIDKTWSRSMFHGKHQCAFHLYTEEMLGHENRKPRGAIFTLSVNQNKELLNCLKHQEDWKELNKQDSSLTLQSN